MTNTVLVSTSQELMTALQSANGDTVITLADGDYGALKIIVPYGDPWGAFANTVTLKAANSGQVTFSGVELRGVTNLAFEGGSFVVPD